MATNPISNFGKFFLFGVSDAVSGEGFVKKFYKNVKLLKESEEYKNMKEDELLFSHDILAKNRDGQIIMMRNRAGKQVPIIKKCFTVATPEDIHRLKKVAVRNLYEVAPEEAWQKFRIDMDFKGDNIKYMDEVLAAYAVAEQIVIGGIFEWDQGIIQKIVCTSHASDGSKYSYHYIYTFSVATNHHAKYIFDRLMEQLPPKIQELNCRVGQWMIDRSVYSTWQNFRVEGCCKYDLEKPARYLVLDKELTTGIVLPEGEQHEWSEEKQIKFLKYTLLTDLTDVEHLKYQFDLPLTPSKRPSASTLLPETLRNVNDCFEKSPLNVRFSRKELLDQFEPPKKVPKSENIYILTRKLDSSGICPLCPKTFQIGPNGKSDPHEGENAYLCVAQDTRVFYHCRRSGDSKSHMIGYLWANGSIESVKEGTITMDEMMVQREKIQVFSLSKEDIKTQIPMMTLNVLDTKRGVEAEKEKEEIVTDDYEVSQYEHDDPEYKLDDGPVYEFDDGPVYDSDEIDAEETVEHQSRAPIEPLGPLMDYTRNNPLGKAIEEAGWTPNHVHVYRIYQIVLERVEYICKVNQGIIYFWDKERLLWITLPEEKKNKKKLENYFMLTLGDIIKVEIDTIERYLLEEKRLAEEVVERTSNRGDKARLEAICKNIGWFYQRIAGSLKSKFGDANFINHVTNIWIAEVSTNIHNLFDSNEHQIPCPPGKLIDFATNEIRDRTKNDMWTTEILATYNPNSDSTSFRSYINDITLGDAQIEIAIQFYCGTILSAWKENLKKAIFLWGPSADNSKSTWCVFLALKVLGPFFATSIPKDIILKQVKKFIRNPEAASPFLASVKGKRLVLISELEEEDQLDGQSLKMLVGEGMVPVRENYGNAQQIRMLHTLLIDTNFLPGMNAKDSGQVNRIQVLPFDAKFVDEVNPNNPKERKKNPQIGSIMNSPDFISSALSWLIEGCRTYYAGTFQIPPRVKSILASYYNANDPFADFLETGLIFPDPRPPIGFIECPLLTVSWSRLKVLHDHYIKWMQHYYSKADRYSTNPFSMVLQKYTQHTLNSNKSRYFNVRTNPDSI